MGALLIFVLLPLPLYSELFREPGPGGTTDALDVRDLDCQRLSLDAARRRHPGEIGRRRARGDIVERDAMLCTPRIFSWGEREARDEAILSHLTETTDAIVSTALEEPGPFTWIVQSHYPNAVVAAKLEFAAKAALVESGKRVSDRRLRLSARDVERFGRMPVTASASVACQRFATNGSLAPEERLLAIYLVHPEETDLHAGLCRDGHWTWLR